MKSNTYFKAPLFQEGLEYQIFLTSKLQACLLKQSFKTQRKLREVCIIHKNENCIVIS